jgi:hypothetical protein
VRPGPPGNDGGLAIWRLSGEASGIEVVADRRGWPEADAVMTITRPIALRN